MVAGWAVDAVDPRGLDHRIQALGANHGRTPCLDRFKLRVPVAGKIVLKATIARFARSFALATRSGVPIVQGLTLTSQTVDNAWVSGRSSGCAKAWNVRERAAHRN